MPKPVGGRIEDNRMLSRNTIPLHNQDKTYDRNDRVDALPGHFTDALYHAVSPGFINNGNTLAFLLHLQICMLNYFQGLWTPLMGGLHSIYLLPVTFLVPNIKYSCYKKHKQQ